MLSIGAMGAGQGAYYTGLAREDYYLAGGEPPGVWYGKGAKDLGLEGRVNSESLNRLFDGYHPCEDRALIQNASAKNHQPGWDLTFSAPKSVSVLWSQADPQTRKIIQDAHFAAVQAALSYLEDTASITRRGKGGDVKENAHLIIATFEHGTSRAGDPQPHTHCLVMNVCTRDDGTSGTIESKPLYQSKMAAGAVYRAELAAKLENGLDLTAERKGSCFEIKGVPDRPIQEFSKRRAEIEKLLDEKGYSGAEAAAAATLATRRVKSQVSRDELFQEWRAVGEEIGWGAKEAAQLVERAQAPQRDRETEKNAALDSAMQRGTAQQSFFTERDFVRYTAEEAQGRGIDAATVRSITKSHLSESPEIVPLGTYKGENIYTTREMMALEAKLFAAIEASKDQYSVGVSETVLTGVIASRLKLNDEQKDALRHICESGDGRIRVVSGMAGTGKTNLLASARFAWELEGFEVYGAALAGNAAKGLSDGSRIDSDTIHKTLYDIEAGRLRLHDKSILVVDESGMVGTLLFEKLVEETEKTGTRLVFVGDKKQLQPVDAGGPLAATEERLGAASLTTIHRQREEWAKNAVHDFAAGRAEEGLAAYAERGLLTVAPDRRQAYNELISAWQVEGIRAPEDHLIFAGTRLDVANLNRLAQTARERAGVLGSESVTTPGGSESFHVGDRVLFTKKSRAYGVENGSLGKVVAVDENHDRLTIRLDDGERVVLRPHSFPHIQLGYAMTTHKGQGATVEKAFILAGGTMQDREITYVQTSRARGDTHLFADAETAGEGLTRLVRQMSESRQKEMAHSVQQIPQPYQP